MSNIVHANLSNFEEEVLKSNKPVVVDFWAPWCGPCKMISPLLDELSVNRSDVKVVKVDVDENHEIAKRFGVRGVPTLCLFNNGEVEATKVGAVNKASLISWIESNI